MSLFPASVKTNIRMNFAETKSKNISNSYNVVVTEHTQTLQFASNTLVLSVTYRSLVAKIICPFETGQNFMELFHHSYRRKFCIIKFDNFLGANDNNVLNRKHSLITSHME